MVEEFLKESRQNTAEIRKRLIASTKNLSDRVRSEGLEVAYGRDEDHLYITVGAPRESLSISALDELQSIVLYDPETFEVAGFEVPFFMERLKTLERLTEANPRVAFWKLVADFIRDHGDTVYIPGDQESEKAERAFREFALA